MIILARSSSCSPASPGFFSFPFQRGFSGGFPGFFHLGLDDNARESERERERSDANALLAAKSPALPLQVRCCIELRRTSSYRLSFRFFVFSCFRSVASY